MTTWTTAAEQELKTYLARTRAAFDASGADGAEVADDLRRHIEQEAATARLSVITESDVRRWLARLGPTESPDAHETQPPTEVPPPAPERKSPSVWLVWGGVVLPAITLAVELATRMCGSVFFDPVPTLWHVLLLAAVPLSNALALRALRRVDTTPPDWLRWSTGFALGIAGFYTVLFAPLLIPGLLASWYFGLGLLPLTPILALISTAFLARRLREAELPRKAPALLGGFALALLALVIIESPVWITRAALQSAASEESAGRQSGLRWLRALGHEETMLRACYGRTRGAANLDLAAWITTGGRDVSPDQAREIYYRVTGRPFNSVPAPRVRNARGPFAAAAIDEWTWDGDQGGENVGGRLKGLTLQTSRLDAAVEPDAALAYLEWTLEFKNVAARDAEARAQVLLPPGGVVSRVTLWVNGEEREAAFAGRGQVREAYERVAIQQRRDPILVTTAGPERVLMQCFPVPRDGGTIRVRIGITAPLDLESASTGILRWPCFIERNFTLTDDVRHSLWVEGRSPIEPVSPALHAEQPKERLFAARGQALDRELCAASTAVRVRRDPAVTETWTADTRSGDGGFVRQRVLDTASVSPARVVLVLDGSDSMKPFRRQIAAALTNLPPQTEVAVILAGDAVRTLADFAPADPARVGSLAARVLDAPATGGQDNVPALVAAWDLAAQKPGSVIVWIHGPQPVALSSVEPLRQANERRANGPAIYEVQVAPGPNRISEKLDGMRALKPVPRLGTLAEDLGGLFRSWRDGARLTTLVREHTPDAPSAGPGTRQGSLQIARLWAADEVRRRGAARQPEPALKLANAYQLVTPISGAVVLETQQQFAQNNLQAADPTSVPSISVPDPANTLVLTLVSILMLYGIRSRIHRGRSDQAT